MFFFVLVSGLLRIVSGLIQILGWSQVHLRIVSGLVLILGFVSSHFNIIYCDTVELDGVPRVVVSVGIAVIVS